ncbi:MAG: class I SAM-dependent methyltransferase [Gammaproteobacteria bacterium]|nr:MAG: class I SAM-dependent methyltransferase [Gammaproteobacteria bacterium]
MLKRYFKGLYQRTMEEAYGLAYREIVSALDHGGTCLDCGANEGYWYEKLSKESQLTEEQYYGIEWNESCVNIGREKGLNIQQGDLNKTLPFENDKFTCIYALSVLEHLLNGCHFLKECHRTLKKDGKLVLLTPNISTYFTAALILAGKMPSSGPHPDSDILMKTEEVFKVSPESLTWDTESDTPVHRHLVVFSYRVLEKYLKIIGFSKVTGHGFGLYPLPNFMQPIFEKIDPYHCHQMVFVAEK